MTSAGTDNTTENGSRNGSLTHKCEQSEKTKKKKKSCEIRGLRYWSSKNNNTKIDLTSIRNIGKKLEEFKSKTVNLVHKLQNTAVSMCDSDTDDVGVTLLSAEAAREVEKLEERQMSRFGVNIEETLDGLASDEDIESEDDDLQNVLLSSLWMY